VGIRRVRSFRYEVSAPQKVLEDLRADSLCARTALLPTGEFSGQSLYWRSFEEDLQQVSYKHRGVAIFVERRDEDSQEEETLTFLNGRIVT
jgi:hypothetical protein